MLEVINIVGGGASIEYLVVTLASAIEGVYYGLGYKSLVILNILLTIVYFVRAIIVTGLRLKLRVQLLILILSIVL